MKYALAAVAAALAAAPVLANEAPVLEVTPGYASVPTTYEKCGMEPTTVLEVRRFREYTGTWNHDLVPVVRDRMRCWTVFDIAPGSPGYTVRFRDEGGEYTAFMSQHPGTTVTLNNGLLLRPVG